MTAVMLLVKAPAGDVVVKLTTTEMGRWIGVSGSCVDHTVLPEFRKRGVGETKPWVGESGVLGLEWTLRALREARAGGDRRHPLALDKKDLATLLRFCEALFAPGWAPKDGPVTPPGLLAARQGRGAATDRLALLLLALQARANGRVALVGGSVKSHRGRADATAAKALGCSVSGGSKVIDRLEDRGLVVVGGEEKFSKARLLIPAIAEACRRRTAVAAGEHSGEVRRESAGGCSCGGDGQGAETVMVLSGEGWEQQSFDDVEAVPPRRPAAGLGDLEGLDEPEFPEFSGEIVPEAGAAQRPSAGPLHATHPRGGSPDGSLSVDAGFSGEAALGRGGLPECARVREDEPGLVQGGDAGAERGFGSPLRGEQPTSPVAEGGDPPRDVRVKPVGPGRRGVLARRPEALPKGLEMVLGTVHYLWERITRSSTREYVAAAVRRQLEVVRGIAGPQYAEQVLAERFERRLAQQMGAPVTDPVGWILGRGLVQRAWCWSHACDEGLRMDVGGQCPSCQTLVADRRGLRARIARETDRELQGVSPEMVQAEIERRLHLAVSEEAAARQARWERTAIQQRARGEVLEQRRAAQAQAEQARLAAPCTDCGTPEAAGMCLVCTLRRSVQELVSEAVDLAVMAHADLSDAAAVAALTAQCAADTRALLDRHLQPLYAQGLEEVQVLFAAKDIAQRVRDRRHQTLQGQLMLSQEALAEADLAYEAKLRAAHCFPDRETALAVAQQCADEAQERAVRFLLAQRAEQLAGARRPSRTERRAARRTHRLRELSDGAGDATCGPSDGRDLEAVGSA
ncbi:hypothetical protein ACIP5N_21875 [Streptomyces sp. NPDC088768]|uniref:hypothetical protein n=1 Tax=Streptomyces sp. NPDC088768 TaxID=3365894 RepID=UPI0037F1FE02